MPKRWLVKSRWLVVLKATTNTRIYIVKAAATREVLVCRRWHAVIGKIFVVKLYSCKIFSYVFCVRKYFCNEKKRITVVVLK